MFAFLHYGYLCYFWFGKLTFGSIFCPTSFSHLYLFLLVNILLSVRPADSFETWVGELTLGCIFVPLVVFSFFFFRLTFTHVLSFLAGFQFRTFAWVRRMILISLVPTSVYIFAYSLLDAFWSLELSGPIPKVYFGIGVECWVWYISLCALCSNRCIYCVNFVVQCHR